MKRDLLKVRKLIAPEREVLQVLSRGDVECYGPEERRYFQDVYDHVVRVTDEIDTLRDLVSNVVDANLAAVSNRLNEVMKVLTALATILLVMTVVTGFFGQNFVTFIPVRLGGRLLGIRRVHGRRRAGAGGLFPSEGLALVD